MSTNSNEVKLVTAIDMGEYETRVGTCGNDEPTITFRTRILNGKAMNDTAAQRQHNDTILHHGAVVDWNAVETLYREILQGKYSEDGARAAATDAAAIDNNNRNPGTLVLSEISGTPRRQRERHMELLFETFNASGLHFVSDAQLACYANGRYCGLAVNIGESTTRVCPIVDGFDAAAGFLRWNAGGGTLTRLLERSLHCSREVAESVKLDFCGFGEGRIAASNAGKSIETNYRTLDGNIVVVTEEHSNDFPMSLFHPERFQQQQESAGLSPPGLAREVARSLAMVGHDTATKELSHNIVLSGATCQMVGLASHLERELCEIFKFPQPAPNPPDETNRQRTQRQRNVDVGRSVRVVAEHDCHFGAWIGLSIAGSLTLFPDLVTARSDYFDCGASLPRLC